MNPNAQNQPSEEEETAMSAINTTPDRKSVV